MNRLRIGRSHELTLNRSLKHSLHSRWRTPRAFRHALPPFTPKFAQTPHQAFVFPSPSPELAGVGPARALLQKAYAHRTDYLQIFHEWNQHRVDAVQPADLAEVLTAHGLVSTPEEAAAVIASVTSSGALSANEVRLLLTEQLRPGRPKAADLNNAQEVQMLTAFLSLAKQKVSELFKALDSAGKGKVSYDQFLQVMNRLNVPYKFVNGKNLKALYEKLGGNAKGLDYTSLVVPPKDEAASQQRGPAPPSLNLKKVPSAPKQSLPRGVPPLKTKVKELANEVRVLNRCHNPAIKFYLPRPGEEEDTDGRMTYARLKNFLEEVTDKVLKGFGYKGFVLTRDGFISKHEIMSLLKAHRINFHQKELDDLVPGSKDTIIALSDLNMRVTRRMYVLSNG